LVLWSMDWKKRTITWVPRSSELQRWIFHLAVMWNALFEQTEHSTRDKCKR
jgi:hypothetical protein